MLWERVAAGPVVWGQLGCMGPTEEGDPLARDAHTGYPYALSGCTLKKESEEGDPPYARSPGPIRMYFLNKLKKEMPIQDTLTRYQAVL